MAYRDRTDAGIQLARRLGYVKNTNTIVLAIPRGGVIPAAQVARILHLPLGLVFVRKIGHPDYPEYAIGAVAEGEQPIYNKREAAAVEHTWRQHAETTAQQLIQTRKKLYYGEAPDTPTIRNATALIIDDGIATGLTMEAAVRFVRRQHPKRIIVAVPVASPESVAELRQLVDTIITLEDPETFLGAVGAHYKEFAQVQDDDVRAILRQLKADTRSISSTR